MSLVARLYVGLILSLGAAAITRGFFAWRMDDPFRVTCYLALAIGASLLKVRLPGITGTMSVSYIVLLASVVELGLSPTLAIGALSVIAQSFWRARTRPRAVQLAFSVANVALAITAAHFVYNALPTLLYPTEAQTPFRLAGAATAYFFANTFPVAVVIALTERKPLRSVWNSCYSWSFAYYLVGAAVVGMFGSADRMLEWQAWLLILPVIYVVYRSYRLYLDRLQAEQRHAAEVAALHGKAVEALNSSAGANARLDAVIQASPLALLALDMHGNVTIWNSSSERIFGWKRSETLGRPLCFRGEASLAGECPQEIARAIVETTVSGESLSAVETRLSRKDGSFFDAAIWSAPLPGPGDCLSGVLVTVADSSDRKRLEKQLRVSQKMEAVGRLAGGVAHDFNNLLTVINGYSAMLAESTKNDAYAHSEAVEIQNAGNRAAALVAQLLTFSRHQVIRPRPLDMNGLVRDVERILSRLIGEHISLTTMLEEDAGWILADPSQIETILINLATNARDAMPDGGVLSITTSRVDVTPGHCSAEFDLPAGSYARLVVSDTGHGMDAQTQQHLFEPFFTTKDVGKGTGLGLSSVYAAIQKFGGRIFVKSEIGAGAEFSIYLPRCEQNKQRDHEGRSVEARRRGHETVLLVEDDNSVRRLAHDVLTRSGYRVLEAVNGADALDKWQTQFERIDLVVTDVVMPVMNGVKLAQELRKRRPELKVLFISGHAEDTILGPTFVGDLSLEFLPKPFHPDMLAHKVRSALDHAPLTSTRHLQ